MFNAGFLTTQIMVHLQHAFACSYRYSHGMDHLHDCDGHDGV